MMLFYFRIVQVCRRKLSAESSTQPPVVSVLHHLSRQGIFSPQSTHWFLGVYALEFMKSFVCMKNRFYLSQQLHRLTLFFVLLIFYGFYCFPHPPRSFSFIQTGAASLHTFASACIVK